MCVLFLSVSFFYLRSVFAAATLRKEEASGVAVAHGRLSARDGGRGGEEEDDAEERERQQELQGDEEEHFGRGNLLGGVEAGTN
jgi:hypothetical protein